MATVPKEPELAQHVERIHRQTREVEAFLAPVTNDGFNWRPHPDRWTMAQCLDHLSETWQQYASRVDRAIRCGRADGTFGTGPFRYKGFLANMLIKSVDPANKKRFKAPKKFVPAGESKPIVPTLQRFVDAQNALDRAVIAADGLDLAKLRFASPITPLIRMSLGQAFRLLTLHADRHIAQMIRIADDPDFPQTAA